MSYYYRTPRKRRYWSHPRYRRSSDQFGSDFHYVFGHNTGEAATIVREVFFNLSGHELEHVLDEYGKKYGKGKKAYAKATISKWKTGGVNMSDALVGRLVDFLPPLMTPEQKNRVVEAIWKAHARRSIKYAYIGPDADVEAFAEALRSYFNGTAVTHAIPRDIQQCFSWLADNDAVAKQQLLNHFMEKQLDAALAAGRFNAKLIVDRVRTDIDGQISKFEHIVIVGGHQVVIKADKLRSGYLFTDSPNDFYKLPFKISPRFWLSVSTATIVGFIIFTSFNAHRSQESAMARAQSRMQVQSVFQARQYVLPKTVFTATPARSMAKPAFNPVKASVREIASTITATTVPHIIRTKSRGALVVANGCATFTVASVNDDGSSVALSNGERYSIVGSLMRTEASGWSTGDEIVACTSSQETTLKRNFETARAAPTGQVSLKSYGCRTRYIGYTDEDGSKLATTDGTTMALLGNDLARTEAAGWSTGDKVDVCAAKEGDIVYVGIKRNFQEVEATIAHFGSGQSTPATCSRTRITNTIDASGVMSVVRGSYRVDNDFMRGEAEQMAVGDHVTICVYSSNGSTYASIATSDFQKVQAYGVR